MSERPIPPLVFTLCSLVAAQALQVARAQTEAEIISMRNDYASAKEFARRGASAGSAGGSCTMWSSAYEMFDSVAARAGRFGRTVNPAPGVMQLMREIEADAIEERRAAFSQKMRWCDNRPPAAAPAPAPLRPPPPSSPPRPQSATELPAFSEPLPPPNVELRRQAVPGLQGNVGVTIALPPGMPFRVHSPSASAAWGATRFGDDTLDCLVWITPFVGIPDADAGVWRPRTPRAATWIIGAARGTGIAQVRSIDGALTWTLAYGQAQRHLRVAARRLPLSVQCDAKTPQAAANARAIGETVRWSDEPTAGERGAPLEVSNAMLPFTADEAQHADVTLPSATIALYQGIADARKNYPTLAATGVRARLPGPDWVLGAAIDKISISRLTGGTNCSVSEGKPWTPEMAAAPFGQDPSIAIIAVSAFRPEKEGEPEVRDGVIVRRARSSYLPAVVFRYVPGKPALVVGCSAPDGDEDVRRPEFRAVLRALAASVRWGDEPAGR